MPSRLPASAIARVMSMSARLGAGSPEGWLWTRMIAAEPRSIARRIDLADMDRGLVDRAFAHHLVADQHVAGVEVEHAEPLDRVMRHVGAQIVEQRLPVGEHRAVGDLRP